MTSIPSIPKALTRLLQCVTGMGKALLLAALMQTAYYAEALELSQTRPMPINELQQKVERNCQCRVISIQNDTEQTVQVRLLLTNGKVVIKKLNSVTGEPWQPKKTDHNKTSQQAIDHSH